MASIKIAKCTTNDAGLIAELEKECIKLPWSEKQILDAMKTAGYVMIKAEQGGSFAGYGSMRLIGEEAEINNIAVVKELRRHNIGRRIARCLITEAAINGAKKIFLEVGETNIAAFRLYESLGFRILYKRKGYYAGENALVMEKQV